MLNRLPKQIVNGVSLSGQEYQVFKLLGQGLSPAEIVRQLGIHYRTIDANKQSIRKKLGIPHYTELISYATREHIKEEIKNGDFLRDDLLAMWISQILEDVKANYLLDLILDFRLLTPEEAWKKLKLLNPKLPSGDLHE